MSPLMVLIRYVKGYKRHSRILSHGEAVLGNVTEAGEFL